MELKLSQIISISGQAGLFKQDKGIKGGLAAFALADGKRLDATDARMKINNLADISIYTANDEIPLQQVFQKINEHTLPMPSAKATLEEIKTYFRAVIPGYNEKKLFPADIKHILSWFNQLKGRVDFSN